MTDTLHQQVIDLTAALEGNVRTLNLVSAQRDKYRAELHEAVQLGFTICEVGEALALRLAKLEAENERLRSRLAESTL